MPEQQSIKDTLNTIRKALEEDATSSSLNQDNNILNLNKLVKEDGTIEIIENDYLNSDEVKEILSQKVSEVFEKHFDKWLEKNIPNYLDKYFNNKK